MIVLTFSYQTPKAVMESRPDNAPALMSLKSSIKMWNTKSRVMALWKLTGRWRWMRREVL
ncbi:hypothetical protein [Peribacillus sp. SCS-37]|uniref:hypothetical protein n=1 Tax=Paraperibacillus esterisolvens TaxID=3115296 RepID=UPI003905E84C